MKCPPHSSVGGLLLFYNFFARRKLKRSPLLLISVCEDDPNYIDKCAEKAAIKDYCVEQKAFMEKECPKSCGFCSSSKSQAVNKFILHKCDYTKSKMPDV